jgi:hypothetical protein
MPFGFEVVLASDQGMSGAFARFHGCSNDNIGGHGLFCVKLRLCDFLLTIFLPILLMDMGE